MLAGIPAGLYFTSGMPPLHKTDEYSTDFDILNISTTSKLTIACSENSVETIVTFPHFKV